MDHATDARQDGENAGGARIVLQRRSAAQLEPYLDLTFAEKPTRLAP
jgi:hypothetical protein